MKARMLSGINALIIFLIGLLGISTTSCFRKKYGVPYYEEPDPQIIALYGCPMPQEIHAPEEVVEAEVEEPTK